jgi:general secretion pathway protein C
VSTLRERRVALGMVFSTLAMSALFTAQGATRLVAAALLGPDEDASTVVSAAPPGKPGANALRRRYDPKPLLRKNIFDSESGDLTLQPEPQALGDGMGAGDGMGDVSVPDGDMAVSTCSGGARLVGAIVAPGHPQWSFAALAGEEGKSKLYRAGMAMGELTLVGIRHDRVYMAPRSGSLCKLQMFGEEDEPGPAAAAKKDDDDDDPRSELRERLRSRREGPISDEELEQGIQKVSETQFNIEQSLVNKILENQAELMRSARIIPHEQDGRTVGVKLYGIRRNSVLGSMGMQNGDLLRNINGFDMTSPDSALQAYTKLRSAERLSVAVERRGKPMTIDYNIQ